MVSTLTFWARYTGSVYVSVGLEPNLIDRKLGGPRFDTSTMNVSTNEVNGKVIFIPFNLLHPKHQKSHISIFFEFLKVIDILSMVHDSRNLF